MANLKLTAVGIPNTCCICGEMQHVMWYANNDDEARSGHGFCAVDAGVKPKITSKKSTRTAVASSRIKQESK